MAASTSVESISHANDAAPQRRPSVNKTFTRNEITEATR